MKRMTKTDFQDLQSPLIFVPIIPGRGKTVALTEASEDWIGKTVWVTARNRITAAETGRTVGAESVNTCSIAILRERVANGDGPEPGDVVVVDEFSSLDHHTDDKIIQELADDGVIVKVLVDLRSTQKGEK